jgi:Tfp pilus assembly protein PilO
MPKNSKLAPKIKVKGMSVTDPRVAMRALVGILLLANMVMAVIAFKPFGASADDLRQQQAQMASQLRQFQAHLEATKAQVAKIGKARTQGDEFLTKYIMHLRTMPGIMLAELTKAGADAGVRILPEQFTYDAIEGSDTLQMVSITAPFEGSYAGLAKLVDKLEKSPVFLIIDSMNLRAPQQQNAQAAAAQNLNVQLKLITFVRDDQGATP